MSEYLTRDLVAIGRPLAYCGQEHQPGQRFRPMSQIDADYLVSRGRAQVAPDETPPPAAPVAAPVPPIADTPPPAADQVAEQVSQPEAEQAADPVMTMATATTTATAAPRRRGRTANAERNAAASEDPAA